MASILIIVQLGWNLAFSGLPSTNLCEDATFLLREHAPDFPWRQDSTHFLETEGSYVNEASHKYSYDPATGLPQTRVSYSNGDEPDRFVATPIQNGVVWEGSDTLLVRMEGETSIVSLRSRGGPILTSSMWKNGHRWSWVSGSDVDSGRSSWVGDTLRIRTWTPRLSGSPAVEDCVSPTRDSCICLNAEDPPKRISRKSWGDGFVVASSQGNGVFSELHEYFYQPFHPTTSMKPQSRNKLFRQPYPIRWNGSRPSATSTSTNPLELLRHGQIPTPAAP